MGVLQDGPCAGLVSYGIIMVTDKQGKFQLEETTTLYSVDELKIEVKAAGCEDQTVDLSTDEPDENIIRLNCNQEAL